MTVQELIDQLRQLPPDHIVLVEGYENGWDTLASIEPSRAARQTPCAEWDGEFERKRSIDYAPCGSCSTVMGTLCR